MCTTPSGLTQIDFATYPGLGNPGLEYATPLGLTSIIPNHFPSLETCNL